MYLFQVGTVTTHPRPQQHPTTATHPSYVSLSYEPHGSHRENLIVQTKASPKGLLENVINKFIEIGFVTDVISFGDNKFMV